MPEKTPQKPYSKAAAKLIADMKGKLPLPLVEGFTMKNGLLDLHISTMEGVQKAAFNLNDDGRDGILSYEFFAVEGSSFVLLELVGGNETICTSRMRESLATEVLFALQQAHLHKQAGKLKLHPSITKGMKRGYEAEMFDVARNVLTFYPKGGEVLRIHPECLASIHMYDAVAGKKAVELTDKAGGAVSIYMAPKRAYAFWECLMTLVKKHSYTFEVQLD